MIINIASGNSKWPTQPSASLVSLWASMCAVKRSQSGMTCNREGVKGLQSRTGVGLGTAPVPGTLYLQYIFGMHPPPHKHDCNKSVCKAFSSQRNVRIRLQLGCLVMIGCPFYTSPWVLLPQLTGYLELSVKEQVKYLYMSSA